MSAAKQPTDNTPPPDHEEFEALHRYGVRSVRKRLESRRKKVVAAKAAAARQTNEDRAWLLDFIQLAQAHYPILGMLSDGGREDLEGIKARRAEADGHE